MYLIGIDVGTTGTKAIVVNGAGRIVGKGYKGYPLITQSGGVVEQAADDWYAAVVGAVRAATGGIDTREVCALSLSAQGASSLLVDADFRPLINALTWMDVRAQAQKERIEAALGGETIYRKTGWRAHASLDAAKLLWLREEGLYERASRYVSTLDYMNFMLAGNCVLDPSSAAIRQLLNIQTRRWDEDILCCIGLDEKKLAAIEPAGAKVGTLRAQAARDTGLHTGVKVYNGAHDQYAGLIGANITKVGDLMLSTGTSWVVNSVSEQPIYSDSYISPAPHVVAGTYGALTSIPVAGAALDWFRNKVADVDYAAINAHVAKRLGRNEDLMFYPYLSGGAFPVWNAKAKGSFVGLCLDHDKYDLLLACMEGVAFQFRMALDEYRNAGISINSVRVMGGATNSPTWLRIIAALCDEPLCIMDVKDTPCLGAAIIAGVGEGGFSCYSEAAALFNKAELYTEDMSRWSEYYRGQFERYKQTWTVLSKLYE